LLAFELDEKWLLRPRKATDVPPLNGDVNWYES